MHEGISSKFVLAYVRHKSSKTEVGLKYKTVFTDEIPCSHCVPDTDNNIENEYNLLRSSTIDRTVALPLKETAHSFTQPLTDWVSCDVAPPLQSSRLQ